MRRRNGPLGCEFFGGSGKGSRRRFHVRGLERRRRRADGKHLAALVLHLVDLFLGGGGDVLVELLDPFEEIRDVKERVAIEADFHEGRLHAWQHACNAAFVNASD